MTSQNSNSVLKMAEAVRHKPKKKSRQHAIAKDLKPKAVQGRLVTGSFDSAIAKENVEGETTPELSKIENNDQNNKLVDSTLDSSHQPEERVLEKQFSSLELVQNELISELPISENCDIIASAVSQEYQDIKVVPNVPELMSNSITAKASIEVKDEEKNKSKPSEPYSAPPLTVVEDPETPMSLSRVSSPPSLPVETPLLATSPTVVKEEKSPNLRAQEALAKLQSLAVTSPETSDEVTTHSATSILSKNEHEMIKQPIALVETRTASKETTLVKTKEDTQSLNSKNGTVLEETQTKRPFAELSQQLQEMQSLERQESHAKVEAMPLSQLFALYSNNELARNDAFVEDFVQNEMKKEGHEFVEILSNYFRARHQLVGTEEDVKELQRKYSELQEEWWIQHTRNAVATGQCADQSRVTATHQYTQRELNKDAVAATATVLKDIRENIANHLCLYAYSAQLSKLQVESYIHNLYMSCPLISDVPKNAGIQVWSPWSSDEMEQIKRFKECISILFMFHRKPNKDMEFTESIRKWTVRLTSSLLRVATFEDHLFVLNHILRCPSGVSQWGVELVQCPVSPVSSFAGLQCGISNASLNHIITAMATVLMPIKAREEFMCQMRINVTEASLQLERNWILVDSDGEEDEDPSNAWLYLHENDIVAILSQFPLTQVFCQILLAPLSDAGVVDYDVRRSTEPMMMQLFAFTTVFIQVLSEGLTTYNLARYKQLNKRLGRLIRQTVSFISDHWLNFKTYYGPLVTPASLARLQAEFDQLFMRATYKILTAQKLGSWQFMADMPYTMVSLGSLWQLLWVLHQGHGQVINLDLLPSVNQCEAYLKDPDSWQQLADNLLHTTTSESIYLLTTFANMAGCRSSEETCFIKTVTLEVFEIAYICNHTREFCSKVGRELLSGIIQTHPVALSFLLSRVSEVMDKVGRMALYLFSDLPVSVWQPTDPDLLILRQWLLNFSLGTQENQLAQTILARINWDVFEETGRLVVDIRLHRHIALLLVEAYTKYISDKKAGFFIMEGMRQMSSYLSTGTSPEQAFNNWTWELALRLKVHQKSAQLHSHNSSVDPDFFPPTLGSDMWLVPLVKEVGKKTPIACYTALTMTNIGHNITNFISEGLDLLAVLTSSYQFTSAINVMSCVVPLFVDCQEYLLENITFIQVVQAIASADESLFKSTRSAIMKVEFPGIVTAQFAEMIQAQISSNLSLGKAEAVIAFWLKVIFKVCKYFTCRNCCYIVDTIIRWCFVKKGVIDLASGIFKKNYQKFCEAAKSRQNVVVSMFQWLSSSNTLPSYMDSSSLPEFPWLAYMILYVEGEAEVNSQLWQTLVQELHNPSRPSVETALKVTIGKLGLEQAPSSGRLVIYRWAQQALDTPYDHPLLPILWQRFFALYLGRQIFDSSISQRASVGERFFENISYSGMLRRMHKRLFEIANFHTNFDPQKRKNRRQSSHSPSTPPVTGLEDLTYENVESGAMVGVAGQEDELEYTSSREFHLMLASLYQTYSLWLGEPRLHDANLYLPALPPQYEAVRLNQVFQGFMGPWLEFVDLDGIQYTLSCFAADWRKRLTCVTTVTKVNRRGTVAEPENASERIIRRLGRYDIPKMPPPLQTVESPLPEITQTVLHDHDSLVHLIKADLDIITRFTKIFSTRVAQHCALDNSFIELIPRLYRNVTKTVTLTAPCRSKVNPLHKCTSPAVLPVQILEAEVQEQPRRQMDENRVEHKQLMIEALLPTPANLVMAVVHTENAITWLIKQSQKQDKRNKLNPTACILFFTMTEMVSEDTDLYPPSKQFFTSCVEVLGQHFVSHDPDQVRLLLQLCLDRPKVAGLVSPHFNPNICSPSYLLDMYGQLVHILHPESSDLVFMLLSKFDISKWLLTAKPTENQRKQLVETLGSAMMACGAELSNEIRMVYGIYLSHLRAVVGTDFPANLYPVFDMILQGSSTEQLSTQVWEVFLKAVVSDILISSVDDSTSETTANQKSGKVKCVDMRLSTAQVKELLDWLSSYFTHSRLSDKNATNFGLLSKWGRYVSHISFLLCALIRGYVVKVVNGAGDMNPFHVIELVWQPLVAVFSPWLQPLATSSGIFQSPWLEADDSLAIIILQAFRECVLFVYNEMSKIWPDSGSGVLALLLMYYLTCIATKSTTDNVASLFTSELSSLPWRQLKPDLQLLETMTRVREAASPACFSLVSAVMLHVEWFLLLDNYRRHWPPELVSRAEISLAVLLVQGHVHPLYGQSEELCRLLNEAILYEWSLVTQEGFTCICSWFLQLCNPRCVLSERSSNLALGLRLLKRIAEFHTDTTWSSVVSLKRQSYVHCVIQQMCQLTYESGGVSEEQLSTVLVNLMSEIEAVESSVTTTESQQEESVALVKEVLSLLNNSNPAGPWLGLVESTVTDWLRDSPKSLLLVPCISAASRGLASLAHMASVMEAALEAYFAGGQTLHNAQYGAQGWLLILSVFQVPQLNQAGYVEEALAKDAFLVLFAYLKHQLQRTRASANGCNLDLDLLSQVLDWTNRTEPNSDNDAKLILWWDVLLETTVEHIRLLSVQPIFPVTGTVNLLVRFVELLVQFGRERLGSGILGAIGLGRSSNVSPRMRLLARALSAFLSLRVSSPDKLHADSSARAFPFSVKTTYGADLVALRRNKAYNQYSETIEEAIAFCQDPSQNVLQVVPLMQRLVKVLFPDKNYLCDIVAKT